MAKKRRKRFCNISFDIVLSIKEKLQFLDRNPAQNSQNKDSKSKVLISSDLERFDAKIISCQDGFYILREKAFDLDFVHGRFPLGDFLSLSAKDFVYIGKDATMNAVSPLDFLFFDTETTGLAGGSGTLIFLFGVGFFTKEKFIVRQFVLPDYSHEPHVLNVIRALFARFDGIISYNGKSYDLPLLKTRCVLNRCGTNDVEGKKHVDLLHTSRRLWKKFTQQCDLQTIEREILGFSRRHDIPGKDIPQLYFEFLENREIEPIVPILKHNVIDILSMVAIVVQTAHTLHNYHLQKSDEIRYDSRSLFHIFKNVGEIEKAISLADSENPNDIRLQIDHALLLKRRGEYEKARKVWQRLTTHHEFVELSYVELAKYYEHKVRNYSKALDIVERAMKRIEVSRALFPDRRQEFSEDWQYRKSRILRKISKDAEIRSN